MKYFLVQMCTVRKSHQMCAFLYSSGPSPLPHLCLKACQCYVWTFLEALLACPLCKPQVYSLTHIKESSMFMLKPDTDVGFDLNCLTSLNLNLYIRKLRRILSSYLNCLL